MWDSHEQGSKSPAHDPASTSIIGREGHSDPDCSLFGDESRAQQPRGLSKHHCQYDATARNQLFSH